jgi:DNA-binding transcriptional ArsR family regulator
MPADPDPRLYPHEAARLFGLLADETRLRLLLRLAEGKKLSVTALGGSIGLSRQAVSYRLTLPLLAGVITARREGQSIFYALAPGRARDILLRHVRP